MNWSTIGRILGVAWSGLAGALALPALLAALLSEPWQPFALAAGLAAASAALLALRSRGAELRLGHRAGFVTVGLVWISSCVIGAIPFAAHPDLYLTPIDALFESVSGFTTTGATVLSGLDALPRSLLLWRSITQWLGGMGIVVIGVAVLPLLGVGGMQLYRAEAPGPTKDKMTPRIAETAKLLWLLYVGLTAAAAALFYVDGMSGFDAINHAMTAVSTGGFSTHDASLGHFGSNRVYGVTTIAMLAGGTSFVVLRRLLTAELRWNEQTELRAYVGVFGLATIVLTADLMTQMPGAFVSPLDVISQAAFQSASILTTTGFATSDFDTWPALSHLILFSLFLVGGMAGSTAGGPKVVRVLLLGKVVMLQFPRLVHPRCVTTVRLGGQSLDERVLAGSLGFMSMWIVLLALGSLALAWGGLDPLSSFSAAAACLGNVGPGFGAAGPSHTFASFGAGSKLVMEGLMLLGRLEIYTLLVLLMPAFWHG